MHIETVTNGKTVYSRELNCDSAHATKVLGFLMEVPQGTAFETTVTTGTFSHTFKHNETLDLRTLVAKVEGLIVRERKVAA